jgi:membrane-associated phospholipid phosphatase
MNPMPVQGLVSLPSYHAAMGLLFIWAFRHVRLLFPAAVVLNIALLASTPTHGGHYLVDVIAGLLVCAVMIWLVRRSSGGRQRRPGRTLAAEAGKS